MNAIRTMAVLGFCVVLAGCAGSHHQVQSTADPGTITLQDARKGIEEGYRRNREAFLAKDVKARVKSSATGPVGGLY